MSDRCIIIRRCKDCPYSPEERVKESVKKYYVCDILNAGDKQDIQKLRKIVISNMGFFGISSGLTCRELWEDIPVDVYEGDQVWEKCRLSHYKGAPANVL
jgi:hypothetical protein